MPVEENKKSLLCIGHRGAMGHAPQNTLLSMRKALELGARAIELDVYAIDDVLLVFHDDRLEVLSDGEGYIQDQSLAYLRSLDVGKGENIPSLDEVCALLGKNSCLNIELKGANTAKAVSGFIAHRLADGWRKDRFLVSSFNHRELAAFATLSPDIKTGALIEALPVDDAAFAQKLGTYSVHLSLAFIDQRFIDDAHQRGLKVFVYTVNHPEDIARMQQMGVDGVFTNYPERVLQLYTQPKLKNGWPN